MSGSASVLSLRSLCLTIGTHRILHDCTLDLAEGQTVVILGPSGSGKSTLMRCLNLLLRADSGQILFRGRDLMARHVSATEVRRMIGMVFQDYCLFEHLDVRANLLLAPRTAGAGFLADADARAMNLLAAVGLADKADRYPHELSGGQQQRVAIARALVMRPELMLFDEPTSALDPESIEALQALFRSDALAGMTKIIVTHDIAFASKVADRIVFMEGGEIVAEAAAGQAFSADANPRLRRFLTHAMPHAGAFSSSTDL
ncbi:amino acid ABC transporter ATP-binding protein [Gluconacetobacter sp. 1b LMG 1731]|uniref:Amino acid ABC transporter ATP-binding protein n=1 Tax=Gluconacetobacter dulcium TaxID=2729096 RepID=A0A7W4INC8_9PROT|nr:amino acid ABC transporter ATP-binding protein [Gluconacetobacter dulcium]MBB2166071.1 amino acid ABC transporter ATP-binding protein [Gluconacetobacter dulcium]MBB2195207.1 amino acid ABC transporter ATP-binding protein [Gluconacetobacter dulcium]